MTTKESEELRKCIESPYYFATTYLIVNGKKFTTTMSQEQFDWVFKERQKMWKQESDKLMPEIRK